MNIANIFVNGGNINEQSNMDNCLCHCWFSIWIYLL